MGIAHFLLFGLISAYFATRKGYSALCWILAAGLIGLAVVTFLPNVRKPGMPEGEAAAKLKRGNTIGVVLSVGAMVLSAGVSLVLLRLKG